MAHNYDEDMTNDVEAEREEAEREEAERKEAHNHGCAEQEVDWNIEQRDPDEPMEPNESIRTNLGNLLILAGVIRILCDNNSPDMSSMNNNFLIGYILEQVGVILLMLDRYGITPTGRFIIDQQSLVVIEFLLVSIIDSSKVIVGGQPTQSAKDEFADLALHVLHVEVPRCFYQLPAPESFHQARPDDFEGSPDAKRRRRS